MRTRFLIAVMTAALAIDPAGARACAVASHAPASSLCRWVGAEAMAPRAGFIRLRTFNLAVTVMIVGLIAASASRPQTAPGAAASGAVDEGQELKTLLQTFHESKDVFADANSPRRNIWASLGFSFMSLFGFFIFGSVMHKDSEEELELLRARRYAMSKNNYPHILEIVDQIIADDRANLQDYTYAAKTHLDRGDPADAIELCRLALGRWPEDPRLMDIQAHAALKINNLKMALSVARRAFFLNPLNPHARLTMALVESLLGDPHLALEILQPLKKNPKFLLAARDREGHIWTALGNTRMAEAAATETISLDHQDPRSHYHLADILSAEEHWEQAALAFRKAIELEPTYFIAWRGLLRVLVLWDHHEEFEQVRIEANTIFLSYPDFVRKLALAIRHIRTEAKARTARQALAAA